MDTGCRHDQNNAAGVDGKYSTLALKDAFMAYLKDRPEQPEEIVRLFPLPHI